MNDETLISELRRVSCLDNLRCLGCGYEHSCSTHGCAIINEAIQRLEALTAPTSNDPLTLEDLREMWGEPIWVYDLTKKSSSAWGMVYKYVVEGLSQIYPFSSYGEKWVAYRTIHKEVPVSDA